ncbi:MAG: hypothetical protein MRZ42_05865, partial [Tenericutes bacterium]|nr:hypothetical protein [Mycoplasmatota bacterium]
KYLLTDKYLNTLLEMTEFHTKSKTLPINFDTVLDENGCYDVTGSVEIPNDSSDVSCISNLSVDINNILNKYDETDRFVIQRAFGLDGNIPDNFGQIAHKLNVSSQAISERYKRIIKKLKIDLKDWDD